MNTLRSLPGLSLVFDCKVSNRATVYNVAS